MKSFEIFAWGFDDNGKKCTMRSVVTPIADESEACDPSEMTAETRWLWVADGKEHGKFPAVILPRCIEFWGSESEARKLGYRKCRMTDWAPA